MGHPITNDEISEAISGQSAEVSVADVDDLLLALQEEFEDRWSEHMATVETGAVDVVAETDSELVFADKEGEMWQQLFDAVTDFESLLGIDEPKVPDVLMAAHHNAAHGLTDYNWSAANPVVINKPGNFEFGQRYGETVINNLLTRGLSPGQAWAFYGVKIRGNSRNQWAQQCGYSDHSAVSEPVRKAEEKISNRY